MSQQITQFYPYHSLPRSGEYMQRDEMNQVVEWWQNDAQGICLLVGGFGAGKTMLVDEFVRSVASQENADQPERRIFTYSFEIANSSERCLDGVYEWLTGGEKVAPDELVEKLKTKLKSLTKPILVVLDALEKALDGQGEPNESLLFSSKNLKSLMDEAVAGGFPNAGWLISSRHLPSEICNTSAARFGFSQKAESNNFQIDYEYGASPYLEIVPVSNLGESSALDILARFELKGTIGTKLDLVEKCGFHAQTIVLSAGYIRAFCDGDIEGNNLTLPPIGASTVEKSKLLVYGDSLERHKRILKSYCDVLEKANPIALEVLHAMAILRIPLPLDLIHQAFCSTKANGLLSNLKKRDFENALKFLVELELLTPVAGAWICHSGIRVSTSLLCKKLKIRTLNRLIANQLEVATFSLMQERNLKYADYAVELIYHLSNAPDLNRGAEVLSQLHGSLAWIERISLSCLVRAAEPILGSNSPRKAKKSKSLSKLEFLKCLNSYCCGLQSAGRVQEANWGFQRIIKETKKDVGDFEVDKLTKVAHTEFCTNLISAGRFARVLKAIDDRENWAQKLSKTELPFAAELIPQEHANVLDPRRRELTIVNAYRLQVAFYTGEFLTACSYLDEFVYYAMDSIGWLGSPDDTKSHDYLGQLIEKYAIGAKETYAVMRLLESFADLGMIERARTLLEAANCNTAIKQVKRLHLEALILLKRLKSIPDSHKVTSILDSAVHLLRKAKKLAETYGFGKIHLDILVTLAEYHQLNGEHDLAVESAKRALFGEENSSKAFEESTDPAKRGFYPPSETGLPTMLAATHSDCNYVICEIKARMFLAKALVPMGKFTKQTASDNDLKCAIKNLKKVIAICERLVDEAPKGVMQKQYLADANEYCRLIESGEIFSNKSNEFLQQHPPAEMSSREEPSSVNYLDEMQHNRPAVFHAYMSFQDVQNRFGAETMSEAFKHINEYYDELKKKPTESAWKRNLGRAKRELGESRNYQKRFKESSSRSAIDKNDADSNYFGRSG